MLTRTDQQLARSKLDSRTLQVSLELISTQLAEITELVRELLKAQRALLSAFIEVTHGHNG